VTSAITRRAFLRRAAAGGACVLAGGAGGWELAQRARHLPTLTEATRLRAQPDAIFRVTTRHRMVAVTFDDGPDPTYTPDVLSLLARHQARATFFCIGVNALAHRDVLAATAAAGHQIANHTLDHPNLELLDPLDQTAEIEGGSKAIVDAGSARPDLFRPPMGLTDDVVGVIADTLHYRTVFWDACVEHFVDHMDGQPAVDAITRRVGPGSIILAHDGGHVFAAGSPAIDRSKTMRALPLLLDRLQSEGYALVDVATLLIAAGLRPGPPHRVDDAE
jgi:peptidoglycan/xylan/chitin deacetylase (PgdA/CDA1 family)